MPKQVAYTVRLIRPSLNLLNRLAGDQEVAGSNLFGPIKLGAFSLDMNGVCAYRSRVGANSATPGHFGLPPGEIDRRVVFMFAYVVFVGVYVVMVKFLAVPRKS